MTDRRTTWTAIGAVTLALLGFVGGAVGSSWWSLDAAAKRWRKIRVEHQGVDGMTTRTKVIFDDAKVAVVGVELIRDPEGRAERAHVDVRGGAPVSLTMDERGVPIEVEGQDGSRALLTYSGTKVRATFSDTKGKALGDEVMSIPAPLRSPMKLAWSLPELELVGVAHAQASDAAEDRSITVSRDVALDLDVTMPATGTTPGEADVEVSCAPLTCIPLTPSIAVPGRRRVRIAVSGSLEQSALTPPPGGVAPPEDVERAKAERKVAASAMPEVARVLTAVALTAEACRRRNLTLPLCVNHLTERAATGAVVSVLSHQVVSTGPVVDQRAVELHYEEQARAKLDSAVALEICLARDGYTRPCLRLTGQPLGVTPMPVASGTTELRRGFSGTLNGRFVMTQSDGADCRFSPSPKTAGPLRLTFDKDAGVMTGTLSANERGTRPGLSCSLGSGDMAWAQSYTATVTQRLSAADLERGGSIDLHLRGTMRGTGSYNQSNCRTKGGGAASCPGGRSDSYSYPIQLLGKLDLDQRTGSGRISVEGAPLATSGTWAIPGEATP